MKSPSFFEELKRRSVYKVAVAYAVVVWLLIQIATQVFPFLQIPDWAIRLIIMLLALGFPIALVIAWAFELTPDGLRRTETAESLPARKRDHAWIYIVVIGLALSVGLFFVGRYSGTRPSSTASGANEKSIAVLPFESLSEDKANAYFADGIQDEILARLSKIADLKVISRTSTQKYKSRPENLREIAQELGVANILEGSVQKSADQVRVTVQLIKAATDSHLWADTYDRKLVDLFQVESDIAQKIAHALEATLTGREKQDISTIGTTSPEAYDAYLRALALRGQQGEANEARLIEHARHAVELDPQFAEAWALLAVAESQRYFFPLHSSAQLERARTAAETVLRLAPESFFAHEAMGSFFYYCLHDYDRALRELNLARSRAPNNAHLVAAIGLVQRRQGKTEESLANLKVAAELDPLNQDIWINLGRTYRGLRRFAEARAMFDRALTIEPDAKSIVGQKAETYVAEGNIDAAWSLLKDLKLTTVDQGILTYLQLLVTRGRTDEAIALVSRDLEDSARPAPPLLRALSRVILAMLYENKGEPSRSKPLLLEAEQELTALRAEGDEGFLLLQVLLEVEARLGKGKEVEQLAQEILGLVKKDAWGFSREKEAVARAYILLGDSDRAFPLLQQALQETRAESLTPALLRFDPFWDRLRDDARFQELTKQAE